MLAVTDFDDMQILIIYIVINYLWVLLSLLSRIRISERFRTTPPTPPSISSLGSQWSLRCICCIFAQFTYFGLAMRGTQHLGSLAGAVPYCPKMEDFCLSIEFMKSVRMDLVIFLKNRFDNIVPYRCEIDHMSHSVTVGKLRNKIRL